MVLLDRSILAPSIGSSSKALSRLLAYFCLIPSTGESDGARSYSVAPVLKRCVMRLVQRGWPTLFSRMAKQLIIWTAPETPVLSSSSVVSDACELPVHVVVLLPRRNISNRSIPQHKCFHFFYSLTRPTAGSPSRF